MKAKQVTPVPTSCPLKVRPSGIDGAPRVFLDLREAGATCGTHRVSGLMRAASPARAACLSQAAVGAHRVAQFMDELLAVTPSNQTSATGLPDSARPGAQATCSSCSGTSSSLLLPSKGTPEPTLLWFSADVNSWDNVNTSVRSSSMRIL